MAENSLLALPVASNDSELLIDGVVNDQPAILSTKIADRFNKQHKHILRNIDTLKAILPQSFGQANFGLTHFDVIGPNGAIRKARAYYLTRDAFSLLVMGFTGKAAILWKLRYIEAFNALEQAQMRRERESLENEAELAREAGYLQGRQEALCLPVMQAERKRGYLDGLKEGRKLGKRQDGLRILGKILAYRQKGLSYAEIARLLGISRAGVGERLSRARRLGLLEPQGNMAEAAS